MDPLPSRRPRALSRSLWRLRKQDRFSLNGRRVNTLIFGGAYLRPTLPWRPLLYRTLRRRLAEQRVNPFTR